MLKELHHARGHDPFEHPPLARAGLFCVMWTGWLWLTRGTAQLRRASPLRAGACCVSGNAAERR